MLVCGERTERYITACCNYPSRLLQCSVNNTSMTDELEGGGGLHVQDQIYQGKVLLVMNLLPELVELVV